MWRSQKTLRFKCFVPKQQQDYKVVTLVLHIYNHNKIIVRNNIVILQAHNNQNTCKFIRVCKCYLQVFKSSLHTPIFINIHHSLINIFLPITSRNDGENKILVSSEQDMPKFRYVAQTYQYTRIRPSMQVSLFKHIVIR